ncbi:hypothetical protein [Bradyrhizobium ivorense]|uniref:hypothetical protein n=1 Tax=Bradyrhizobium ivorense TaxID=2511166 RepID=UPI0010B4FED0|nr:hypothetical protein [Bradyrhizobium ivorense]VIO73699.1 hypothetical protein CI41S_38050 [Bradyrhizobium ivorense]
MKPLARKALRVLNLVFWLTSTGVWLILMAGLLRHGYRMDSKFFWVNFLLFVTAGLGVLATTHFAAAAFPLAIGIAAVTTSDVKASAVYASIYVAVSVLIGIPAILVQLNALLDRRNTPS